MTLEETIEAELCFCEWSPGEKEIVAGNIAQAIRDAGYIQRSELLTDEAIERATRAAAEADGQVWDGLSCKHIYAMQAGAAIQAAIGEPND